MAKRRSRMPNIQANQPKQERGRCGLIFMGWFPCFESNGPVGQTVAYVGKCSWWLTCQVMYAAYSKHTQIVFSVCRQVIAKPIAVQMLTRISDKSVSVAFWWRCIRIASVIGGACYIHRRLGGTFVMIQRR